MKLMRFQVLSLKVLALREVVRERLDCKGHLVGYTRQELDKLLIQKRTKRYSSAQIDENISALISTTI